MRAPILIWQGNMITSASNQQIKQLALWQKKAKSRNEDGIFIAEGFKMFMEAPQELIKMTYVSEKAAGELSAEISDKLESVGYEVVADSLFEKISDTMTPQGVLTVISQPQYALKDILAEKSRKPLLVFLEDLQDPGNLGTILRTSEGAGVTGVILSKDCVDIFNPKVVRATMGSMYRVPFVKCRSEEDFKAAIDEAKAAGVKLYAAHLKGTLEHDGFDYTGGSGFLIGNEGNGLKEETAKLADSYLRIPMEGKLESLNAAVATALLIYEAHRQRKEK